MLSGEAMRQAAGKKRRFRILNKRNEPQWHYLWEANPNIVRPSDTFDGVIGRVNGKRHYMTEVKPDRYTFCEYEPVPAPLKFGPQAQTFARMAAGCIVFNPTVKPRAPVNKNWGIERWQSLITLGREFIWLQVGEPGSGPQIRGAQMVTTPSFLDAAAVLSGALAAVLHEGGLHHAAAAVGVPAVVIRGGYISGKVTGYAGQADLFVEDPAWPLGCGARTRCQHCDDAMASITPAMVLEKLRGLVAQKRAA